MSNKLKTKSGRFLILPTAQEDAVITKAAVSDQDSKPLSNAQWKAVKPKSHRLSSKLSELLVATPSDAAQVPGWDEMPSKGAEF